MMALLQASSISEWNPAAGGLISSPMMAMVDGAFRAVLAGGAVWAGMSLLGARNVVAQKAAWGLVLAGALLMPIVVPWAAKVTWLLDQAKLVVPTNAWFHGANFSADAPRPVTDVSASSYRAPDPAATGVRTVLTAPVSSAQIDRMPASAPSFPRPDRFPAPVISNGSTAGPASEA